MKLICIACGNYTYFEAEVEGLRAVIPAAQGVVVEDAVIDDDNWSDGSLRDNLQDVVDWFLKQNDQALHFDADTGHYYNSYVRCARCGSPRVCPPYSKWTPPRSLKSLEEELLDNREELNALRKERHHANHLPVLWKP
ncbi:MAG: hypothetical protein V3U24_10710 [Candidatus Neomarinimicrobiota bacterium]